MVGVGHVRVPDPSELGEKRYKSALESFTSS